MDGRQWRPLPDCRRRAALLRDRQLPSNFGRQSNIFQRTQIDGEGVAGSPSAIRLFAETGWEAKALEGEDILEVGSGAGRFSRVILQHSDANLFSIDYSTAVEANWSNNAALHRPLRPRSGQHLRHALPGRPVRQGLLLGRPAAHAGLREVGPCADHQGAARRRDRRRFLPYPRLLDEHLPNICSARSPGDCARRRSFA